MEEERIVEIVKSICVYIYLVLYIFTVYIMIYYWV